MTVTVSDSASRLFEVEFAQLSALVQKRLELEWRYHYKIDVIRAVPHLFEYAVDFGRLLRVVYHHRLFGSLQDEAEWYAAVFAARGSGHDSFAVVLESWIVAIQGVIKPPECNELAQPLQAIREALPGMIKQAQVRPKPHSPESRSSLVANLLRGDIRGGRDVISRLLNEGRSLDRLIVDVMLPAMAEIGQLWESYEIEIFQEHLATEALRSLLACLPLMTETSRLIPPRTALISCVPGDEHELVPLALSAYLESRGWGVKNLGVSLPADQIARAVVSCVPDTLFLALTRLSQLDAALETVEKVRQEKGDCSIIIGGRGAVTARAIIERAGASVAFDFDDGYLLALGGLHDA